MLRSFAPLAALVLGSAAAAAAQTTYLYENHDAGVPGAGWSQIKVNPAAQGWIPSLDLRAWHEDEPSSVGTTEDLLVSPSLDLRGAGAVYAHFDSQLNFAQWLANHPSSLGDGENDLWVSTDGGANWTEVWTDTRTSNTTEWTTVDLSAYAGQASVLLALRFYGTYAQEWWVDEFLVDDDPANPLPPPVAWSVNLPAASVPVSALTGCDGFETYAGTPPAHMALTALDAATSLPDPEAWCSIAGGSFPAASGMRNLEMGLVPGSTNYHQVRNALVIGLDGINAGFLTLDFQGINFGEESSAADGVWVSADGVDWYRVLTDWWVIPSTRVWSAVSVDLSGFHTITDGGFYLMFQQQDDFAYGDLDGIGVDQICISASGPIGPTLTRSGTCPGPVVLQVGNATANSAVALFYGPAGSFTQSNPNKPCLGLSLRIQAPRFIGILNANSSGEASLPLNAPSGACGVTLQVVDLATCTPSNTILL